MKKRWILSMAAGMAALFTTVAAQAAAAPNTAEEVSTMTIWERIAAEGEVKEAGIVVISGNDSTISENGAEYDTKSSVSENDGTVSGGDMTEEGEASCPSRIMYLTFDDGPSAENTTAVLDILKTHNIHATFFVVGENVRKNPEVARRIVAEGHTIGIHCNCHEYETIYQSADAYIADFEEAYRTVVEVTGAEPKLFRFPGGSVNAYNAKVRDEIIQRMTEKGFVYFDWNASLEDAVSHSEPEKLVQNARETTLGRKRVVLLGHDIVYNTVLCLEDLIEAFPEYRMEPLTEEVEPVQF